MRLFTGDECGLLKECIPELARNPDEDDREVPIAPRGAMPHVTREGVSRIDPKESQTRRRGIIDMTFITTNNEKNSDEMDGNVGLQRFAALRLNGTVEFWEGSADTKRSFGKYSKLFTSKSIFETQEGLSEATLSHRPRPLSLGSFPKGSRLCAGDTLGNLFILNSENGKVVQSYNAYLTSNQGQTISYTPGNNLNTQLATGFGCDPINNRVAVGGRERETTILELATGKMVFKAKNLPPDPQTLLQHPVWPSSILFLEPSNNVMAVGTAYKQVRLYDVRDDSKVRRPIATTPDGLLEYRVTALCQVDEREVVVGDAAGFVYRLDLRTLGRDPKCSPQKNSMVRYLGPAGSVRQLKKHPRLPLLAAVGLDRMLRIYDINNRKQLHCVYLKQRLNCLLFGNDDTWDTCKRKDSAEELDYDEEDRDIDQDDLVQDYIDSEGEGENNEQATENSNDDDPKDVSDDGDESSHSDSDNQDGRVRDGSTSDSSVSDDDASSDVSNVRDEDVGDGSNDRSSDEDSNSDEEIVIKVTKKQRRK